MKDSFVARAGDLRFKERIGERIEKCPD